MSPDEESGDVGWLETIFGFQRQRNNPPYMLHCFDQNSNSHLPLTGYAGLITCPCVHNQSMATRFNPPNVASDALFYISASIIIQCPASHAFDMQLDTKSWPKWNSFCPEVEVARPKPTKDPKNLQKGDQITLHVRMTPDAALREQKVKVSDCEDPRSGPVAVSGTGALYRVCWTIDGWPHYMLRGKRVNEFRDMISGTGEPQCEYRTWEAMSGPLARAVKMMYFDALQSRFEDWAEDLKKYAESTWTESQSSKKIDQS